MATSPNFGWLEPDNTDLVKNGALAIRTAVNAIDASMAELKGGTTGQVLSKTSATDMDFTWTTPSTTAGYGINPILNSSFQIWQRGTSIPTSGASVKNYTADQWNLYRGALAAGATVSRQVTGDTTNLPNIQYCARVSRDLANTGTQRIGFESSLETLNSIPFAGKTVTFSFYARKGANFSAASSILPFYVVQGTGTDQNCANTGFTSQSNAVSGNATLTTTWQRFTATGTILATSTEIGFSFLHDPTGVAGAADYYEVTGVMLEVGSTATAYHTNQPTIQGELAACQRYYQRYNFEGLYGRLQFLCGAYSTTQTYADAPVLVPLRVKASAIEWGGNIRFNSAADAGIAVSTLALGGYPSTINTQLSINASSGLTTGTFYKLQSNNDATAYIAVTAEL